MSGRTCEVEGAYVLITMIYTQLPGSTRVPQLAEICFDDFVY